MRSKSAPSRRARLLLLSPRVSVPHPSQAEGRRSPVPRAAQPAPTPPAMPVSPSSFSREGLVAGSLTARPPGHGRPAHHGASRTPAAARRRRALHDRGGALDDLAPVPVAPTLPRRPFCMASGGKSKRRQVASGCFDESTRALARAVLETGSALSTALRGSGHALVALVRGHGLWSNNSG